LKALGEDKPRKLRISLGAENPPPDAKQAHALCGGVIEVFINVLHPKPRLILVGGGHVGKPIGDIGNLLGYRVVVLDTKPELANTERYPYAERIIVGDIPLELGKLELGVEDIVVIAYGDPEVDYKSLKTLLEKDFKGHAWILCSRKRASWMLERLAREGFNIEEYRSRNTHAAGLDINQTHQEK